MKTFLFLWFIFYLVQHRASNTVERYLLKSTKRNHRFQIALSLGIRTTVYMDDILGELTFIMI